MEVVDETVKDDAPILKDEHPLLMTTSKYAENPNGFGEENYEKQGVADTVERQFNTEDKKKCFRIGVMNKMRLLVN